MNPPSEDIKDMFADSSSAAIGIFSTNLFTSQMPDSPDLCICINDSPSWKPPETNYDMDYPSIQILVRGTPSGYLTAYAKAADIKNELHSKVNTRQGAYYISIVAATDIFPIGRDEKNRPLFSINFDITRKP